MTPQTIIPMILQVDFSQAQNIQTYALGSLVIVLIAGIVGMYNLYSKEREENKANQTRLIEVIGELRELIRNNNEVLNRVKEKL